MSSISIRGILLIIVALMAAVGTALFARSWIAQQQAAFKARPMQSAPATETRRVLVATQTMEAGRFVRAEDLRWAAWPKDGVADGYVVDGETPKGVISPPAADGATPQKRGKSVFDGAVVRARITAGEPVTALKLVQPGERGFLAAVLEPGKRAVSVPVNATTGIAGFIFPGDLVDVIFIGQMHLETRRGDAEGSKVKKIDFSETLMSGARIIAMDQKVEIGDGQAKVSKTATLEVTPKQAEKVALALKMGSVSLSLHSLARHEDTAIATDRFADVARAVGALETEAPAPDLGGSYTLEFDIMSMLGDKRFRSVGGARGVNVIRADKAEQANF
jgi:pilus assembly protein CpaB